MASIHPTAIVDKGAKIASTVNIGPYCVVGPNVELCEGVKLFSHVCIEGDTYVGENTEIYPFAVIGYAPPDRKYQGEDSKLVMGKNNIIREHVTIHTGTAADKGQTTIGDNCLLMANAHVAHDCVLGNGVIMANCAALAGHVVVEDYAIIGGLSAVHQRVRIGAYSIIGGMSGVDRDLIPFGRAMGERATLAGLNVVGLKRSNIGTAQINSMNRAFKQLFLESYDIFEKRLNDVAEQFKGDELIGKIVEFVRSNQDRALCKPATKSEGVEDAA